MRGGKEDAATRSFVLAPFNCDETQICGRNVHETEREGSVERFRPSCYARRNEDERDFAVKSRPRRFPPGRIPAGIERTN